MTQGKEQIFTEIGAMTSMIGRIQNLAEMVNDSYQLERISEEVSSIRDSLELVRDATFAIIEAPNE